MKIVLLVVGGVACAAIGRATQSRTNPTDPQPTCNMCPGTVIPLAELEAPVIDPSTLDSTRTTELMTEAGIL